MYIRRHILNLKSRITAPYALLDTSGWISKGILCRVPLSQTLSGNRTFWNRRPCFPFKYTKLSKQTSFLGLSPFKMSLFTLYMCSQHSLGIWYVPCGQPIVLTHWGSDKMAAVPQTALSNAFSWMKMLEFRLKCHWSLFLRVQLTIIQHWFR